MTATVAEPTSGTGDLGAVGTNGTAWGDANPTAVQVGDTVGVVRPERIRQAV